MKFKLLCGSFLVLLSLGSVKAMDEAEMNRSLLPQLQQHTQTQANENITGTGTLNGLNDNLTQGSPAQILVNNILNARNLAELSNHLPNGSSAKIAVDIGDHAVQADGANAGRLLAIVGSNSLANAILNVPPSVLNNLLTGIRDAATLLALRGFMPAGSPAQLIISAVLDANSLVNAIAAIPAGQALHTFLTNIQSAANLNLLQGYLGPGPAQNMILDLLNAATLTDIRLHLPAFGHARDTIDNVIAAPDLDTLEGLLPAGAAKDGLNALFDAADLNAIWVQLKIGSNAANAVNAVLSSDNLTALSNALPAASDSKNTVDAARDELRRTEIAMSYLSDYASIPADFANGSHHVRPGFGTQLVVFLRANAVHNGAFDDLMNALPEDAHVPDLGYPSTWGVFPLDDNDPDEWQGHFDALDQNSIEEFWLAGAKSLVNHLNTSGGDASVLPFAKKFMGKLLAKLVP